MEFRFKNKKFIWIMLLVVFVSIVFTSLIINNLTKETSASPEKYWFFKESLETGQTITLENAFLVSSLDGQLEFVHDGENFCVKGELEEDVSGIVDIVINGTKISKIRKKTDLVVGILESYTDDTLCLSTTKGTLLDPIKRKDSIPVYRVDKNTVTQVDWNHFIIGISKLNCIIENGVVCAIVIEEDVLPSDVRVIIKNGSEIFYDNLYIKKESDNSIININAYLDEQEKDTVILKDSKGLFLCNSNGKALGEAYEGSFKIVKTKNGLVLVNVLPLETYLKYVVPSEMPTYFGEEALKCQAVCARTYAYAQMYNQTYAIYGANMDDSTSFQVYHKNGRYDETDTAVESTAGEVITRNGELITSYYYSTNPADTNSPFCSWSAYLNMSKAKNADYGDLTNIKIISQNEAGYATEIEMIYQSGTRTITNEYFIRKEIGKILDEIVLNNEEVRTDLTILPSAYFKVVKNNDGTIVLKGGGFGHGIGMSQYGARALSDAGYSYKEIIEFYYDNVSIKQLQQK